MTTGYAGMVAPNAQLESRHAWTAHMHVHPPGHSVTGIMSRCSGTDIEDTMLHPYAISKAFDTTGLGACRAFTWSLTRHSTAHQLPAKCLTLLIPTPDGE